MSVELITVDDIEVPHAFETRAGSLASLLPTPTLRLRQIHGARVHTIDERTDRSPYQQDGVDLRPEGDALVTTLPGVALAVSTGDCVPVLLVDPGAPAVGAAHAGWRGIAAGVLPATVERLVDLGAVPDRMSAAIGPCIGAEAYVVGEEVRVAFETIGLPPSIFRAVRDGGATWRCDLAAAARRQLRDAGLDDGSIATVQRCTLSEPAAFHSYRRDGEASGRMLSGIALPS